MATDELASGPLTGLRAIEFGQLLAGPVRRHAARRLRRRRRQGRGAARAATRCASGAGCATTTTRCGGRCSRATSAPSRSTCASRAGRRSRPSCARAPTSIVENFRPGHDGALGPRPRAGARASTRAASTRASPATARPAATATAPGFAAGGEAISGLRYINGYPDQAPPRSGISPRRHARRAVGVPGHPDGAVRARRARRDAARSSTRRSPTPASR